jgi:hypothetical protein
VSEMLNTMNWQTLQECRLRTRLIMFHKVINENIAIPTQNILLASLRQDLPGKTPSPTDKSNAIKTEIFFLLSNH